MRLEFTVVYDLSLPLIKNFIKTEAAILPMHFTNHEEYPFSHNE